MRIVEIVGHYILLSSSFISSDITSFISFVFISSSYILYNCSHRDYSTDISHFSYLFHALHATSYTNSQSYLSYLNYHTFLDIFFVFVFFNFFSLVYLISISSLTSIPWTSSHYFISPLFYYFFLINISI